MSTSWRDRYLRSRYMVQKTIREYNEKPALRAYLEIFLTLIAISLFGIFAIRPTVTTIGKLLKEIKAKEDTLKTMDDKINNLNIARDLYTKEADKIKLIEDAVPKQPNPDGLALQIEELAKKDNVFVNHFTIEDAQILGGKSDIDDQNLTLTLNISGDYSNLTQFANDVENLRRPIKFDSFAISLNQSKNGRSLFLLLNNLSTPYFSK